MGQGWNTLERVLPLQSASLEAHAAGGIARVVFRQHFRNTHAEPLAVTYSLPLPSDAAVSGFAFVVGDRRIVGESPKTVDARRTNLMRKLGSHDAQGLTRLAVRRGLEPGSTTLTPR